MIESEAEARAFVAARCDDRAMRKFERLIVLLREENTRQNLVAARSLDEVWLRHIADSVQLLDHAGSDRSGDRSRLPRHRVGDRAARSVFPSRRVAQETGRMAREC